MWFKRYGFKENPFVVKSDIRLIGLEKEKEKLKEYIYGKTMCLISGTRGLGKTSLLYWLKSSIKKHNCFYLNAETLDKNFNLDKFLRSRGSFFRKYPKNTVLLLDESQLIQNDFKSLLKLYWDQEYIKSIVFVENSSLLESFSEDYKERIGDRIIKLDKIDKSNAVNLIKLRSGKKCPFDELAIETIIEASSGNPRRILSNCEEICISINKKDLINKHDVENILKEIKIIKEEKKLDLSPMQKKIIETLKEGDKTTLELVELLGTTEGSIGKQLSKLNQTGIVKIVKNTRPKVYGLIKNIPSMILDHILFL